jgi:hypothetical protein
MTRNIVAALAVLPVIAFFSCGLAADIDLPERAAFDPDLYNWKTASWSPFTVNDSISGFAYGTVGGQDRYVAVAKSGKIAWSNDGDIWHSAEKFIPLTDPPTDPAAVPDPFDAKFNAVARSGTVHSANFFVAVGNAGKIAYSSDGIQWTAGPAAGITGFGTENIMGIAFGLGTFVAVGGNGNIAYSSDGVTWTGCKDNNFSGTINTIAFSEADGYFYIAGDAGRTGYSDNPKNSTNWHLYQYPADSSGTGAKTNSGYPFFGNSINKITIGKYGNDTGIGVAFSEWGGRRLAICTAGSFRNATGHNWDADLDAGQFGSNTINGIAFGGDCFVAAGTAAMIGWWQSDAPSNVGQRYWRALSFPEFQWWEITALAALKDRFYVGGIGGKIGYSQ